MSKITLSYWVSAKEHHTTEWEVPFFDIWPIHRLIDDHVELMRLKQEEYQRQERLSENPGRWRKKA